MSDITRAGLFLVVAGFALALASIAARVHTHGSDGRPEPAPEGVLIGVLLLSGTVILLWFRA